MIYIYRSKDSQVSQHTALITLFRQRLAECAHKHIQNKEINNFKKYLRFAHERFACTSICIPRTCRDYWSNRAGITDGCEPSRGFWGTKPRFSAKAMSILGHRSLTILFSDYMYFTCFVVFNFKHIHTNL